MASLPHISVVDDDDAVRKSLQRLIRSAGFTVEMFASAEEFLNSDHLGATRCLILDVRMHGMNGFDLQRQLRQISSEIPIIFITARDNDSTRRRFEKSGAVYLWKPVDEQALLHAIRRAIGSDDNAGLGGTKVH